MPETGQKSSKEHTFFKTSADSSPPPGRYTPTCSLCGKQHWPLDPSCLGRKGAKENARAKSEAKRQAKLKAKAERQNRVKAQKDAKNKLKYDEQVRSFADKISRIQSEARQAIAKTESQAKADAVERAQAEKKSNQLARDINMTAQQLKLATEQRNKAQAIADSAKEQLKQAQIKQEQSDKNTAKVQKTLLQQIRNNEILEEKLSAAATQLKENRQQLSVQQQLTADGEKTAKENIEIIETVAAIQSFLLSCFSCFTVSAPM